MSDPYSPHPALDDLKARVPGVVAMASKEGPSPRLFGSTDVPRATASGNPPTQLLDLPWKLRHAAAEADQAEWARLVNNFGKGQPDADLLAELEPAAAHPANGNYLRAVSAWASGPPPKFKSGGPHAM